jgi:DNA-binding beta-propeller fold protein YncE
VAPRVVNRPKFWSESSHAPRPAPDPDPDHDGSPCPVRRRGHPEQQWPTCGQNGVYSRLDLETKEMRVWDAPKGRGPYGITATPDGAIYYASFAGNHIARIDTTGWAEVIEPPTPKQGARRV